MESLTTDPNAREDALRYLSLHGRLGRPRPRRGKAAPWLAVLLALTALAWLKSAGLLGSGGGESARAVGIPWPPSSAAGALRTEQGPVEKSPEPQGVAPAQDEEPEDLCGC